MHTTLHRNVAFRRVSPTARLVFYTCLEIAGDLEQDGALFVRGAGPMSVAEIADEVGIKAPFVEKALDELLNIGPFLSRRDDQAFVVEKWQEKTAPSDPTAADRKRKSRGMSRVTPPVTGHDESRPYTRSPEEEVEEDIPAPRGADAPPFLIDQAETPERLADPYLVAFLNCKSDTTKARKRGAVVAQLRDMRAEGHSWPEIFTAAHQAHQDGRGAPLWQAGPVWSILRKLNKHNAGKPHDVVDIGGKDAVAAMKLRTRKIG